MEKNKQIIIFDFDGTFYSGKNVFDYVKDYVDEHRRDFLAQLSDEEYQKVISENPEFLDCVTGGQIIKVLYQIKDKYPNLPITSKDFVDCQEKYIYNINLENAHFVDTAFLKKVCETYPTYVVSNSAISHIHFYMSKIGIDPQWFKQVIGNRFEAFDPTKKHYYQEIMNKENAAPSDVHVFGDSQTNDLNPAIELGMNAHLVNDSHEIAHNFFGIFGI